MLGRRRCSAAFAILLLCLLSLGASIPSVPTNTWQQGGALSTARTGATATLMADGRVLIVGGKDGNGNALETAEVLNTDGTIAPVSSMLTPRYGHSAILLHDGSVLVAGGHTSGGGVVNSAELFDPVANTWRWASNTMTDARADFTLSQLIDGNVLVAGGDNGSGPVSGVEKFDLLTEAFQYIGSLNTARKAHAASVLKDGRVLITGGSAVAPDGSTIALSSTEIYNPNSTFLSPGPMLKAARYGHSSTTLIDGTVLLAGGNNGSADLASLEVFDPVANSMTTSSATLSTPRSGHVALLLPNNNHVLIAGGTSAGSALSSTELYRSWMASILANAPMSAARGGAAGSALQLDGTAMVAGGSNLGSTELYGFATIKTDASDYPPGTNVHITGTGWVPGETVALSLVESPLIDTHGPYTVTADTNGNISDNSFTTDAHDLNVAFALTAVGSKSQAVTTFTDGDFGTVTVGPQLPTPVVPGGSAQYAITVGLADNTCTVNPPTISNLPLNATGVFSAYSISGSTYSSTLTVSTTAATPLGSPTFIVTVTASPVMGGHGSNCSGNKTVTQNGTLAVALGATTTTVSSSSNPSDSGSPVTFTATVTPNVTGGGQTPTGSVIFKDGSTALGSAVTLNGSGVATLTTSTLAAGSHSITAVYSGSSGFSTSTSTALTQTVRATAVFSSLPASTSISYGQASTTVSGHVANSANTVLASSPDTVTVTINNTPLSIPIQTTTGNFSGTFNTSSLPASSTAYTIQYSFAGDANLTSASDSSRTLTVSKVTPTVAWSTPVGITYGTALSATQLNATATYQSGGSPATVAGTFTYTPAAGTILSAGNNQTLSVHFVPTDATDFATPVDKTVTLNVQTASLTPSITASNKTYDGTTAATFTCSLSGVVGTDDVSCTGGTAVFASAAAGTGTTVTATGLQLTGAKAANYTLASTTATTTANIITKALTISGVTAADKVYDGTMIATLNAASATLQGVVPVDASLVTLQSGAKAGLFADKNVGVGKAVTASGFTLSGVSAGNYTLAQPTGLTASITAKPLTVSGITASDKVYDATTNATLNTAGAALVGVVSGETVSLVTTAATGSFSDKNVGTGKTITVAGLTLASTPGSTNYSLTQPTATASITAKTLTVSGVTAANKTYDGTLSASLNTTSAALAGVISGDIVTLGTTGSTGSFADKAVGTAKLVTVTGISLSGTDAQNYALTQPTATADITAKSLTITVTVQNKIYDGSSSAIIASQSLTGIVGQDAVSLAGGTGTFANKNAGVGKTVTVSGLTLSGADAGNYIISTSATTTADITPRPLHVTATGNSKVYDGNVTAGVTLHDDRVAGDNLTDAYVGAVFGDKNVGQAKTITVSGISISGADLTNYSLANVTATATADITAKALTVSATADDKVYDGNSSATAHLSDNRVSGDMFTETYAAASFPDKTVGAGRTVSIAGISISGSDAGNYNLSATTATATASITARPLVVTATGLSRKYDGTTAATVTLSDNRLAGDVFTDSYTGASFADRNVGTGKPVTVAGISLMGADAANYAANATATTAANITQRLVTISAMADAKIYDATVTSTAKPALSGDGLVGGDTESSSQTFDTKNVGTGKTLTPTGTIQDGNGGANYQVTFVASHGGSITPRPLTVSATGVSKQYDGLTAASVTLSDDRLTGDVFTDSYTGASFVNKNVGTGKTISVTGISISGADATNYGLVNATATATADITSRALTVSATADDKVYDGNTTAIAHLSDNRVNGDTFTETYTAASFPDKTVGAGRTVSITGISISGSDAGNYNLSATTATATASITARPLHVTATGQSRKYDGTTIATVTLSDDRLPGDTLTESYSSASFADRNVGSGKPVSVAGISIAGVDAGNYAANTSTTTTATITQRLVTISAVADAKIYDATVTSSAKPALSGDGLAMGDAASSSQTFDNKNVGTGKTLTPTGTIQDGNGGANYQVTFVVGYGGSITPRSLNVSAAGVSKQYDGLTAASVTLSDSRLAGDVFTDSYAGASFADKNVGTGKTISVAGISIAGADATNYSLVNATATASADITARGLTVSAIGANKTYDGNTTATVQLTDDRLAGDSLTDSYGSATFDSRNVGTGKTVSVSGITVSGSASGNYNLANTSATTTANISARHLTVNATGVDKTYDGTTTATVTLSDDRLAGDTITDGYSSASFSDKNVGSGKPVTVTGISISGADAANYSANPSTATTASISPRKLTITAVGVAKVYDGTTAASVTLADDRVSGDLFTDVDASATFNDKNVGTAKIVSVSGITISGIDAANYGPVNATASTAADITPRSLTVSATASNKPYDGTTSASVTLNDNRVQGDALTDAFTGATFSDKNAGVAKTVTVTGISISGVDVGNYVLGNTTASAAADITARAIDVTAASDSKTYDATTASSKSPSITVGMLAAGDSATYTQTFDSKNAGTRSLVPSIVITDGNNGHNYSVNFHNANGTISPLTIAGSITVLDKTYDGTISAAIATRTLSGVLANDVVSYAGGTATFSDSNAGAGKTVTVVGLYLAGSDAGNYTVNSTATTTAAIAKADQQISWSAPAPIVFGTSLGNTQLNATVTGVQGGTLPGALMYSPAAGTILGVGTRQLHVDAVSTINYNPASLTVSIIVSYSTGACLGDMGHSILQPINADGSSTFKQGSTVPAKFRVCDVTGHSIGTAGVVTSFNLIGTISGTASTTVDEAVISTTPDANFRWDSTSQQWIFNVSTKPLSAQTTYVYSIGLNDGSTIFFRYGLPR